MDEKTRSREVKRLRWRRRLSLTSILLLILIAGSATNAYLAFRPPHVQQLVERSLRLYFGSDVQFSSGIDVGLPEGIQVHHLGAVLTGSGEKGAASATLDIRSLTLRPRLRDILIGRLSVAEVTVESPVLGMRCDSPPCGSLGSLFARLAHSIAPEHGGMPAVNVRNGEILYHVESAGQRSVYRLFDIEARLERSRDDTLHLRGEARSPYSDSLEFSASWRSGEKPALDLGVQKLDLAAISSRLTDGGMQDVLHHYDIHGNVDIEASILLPRTEDEDMQLVGASGHFRGGHAQLSELAVPLENLEGRLQFEDGKLTFDPVEGRLGTGAVSARGVLTLAPDLSRVVSVEGRLEADEIPSHSRVFTNGWQLLRDEFHRLRPSGTVGLEIVLAPTPFPLGPESVKDVTVKTVLKGLSVQHRDFPLSLTDMVGTLLIGQGEVKILDKLTGWHGGGLVSVIGSSSLEEAGRANFKASFENVVFDETLRNAFPADVVYLWDEIRPAGVVELLVFDIGREAGAEKLSKLLITAQLRNASCTVQQFPCEFMDVGGTVTVDALRERIEFEKLEGKHNGEFCHVSGFFGYGVEGKYGITATMPRMTLGRTVRTALPGGLRRIIEEFGLRGTVETVVTLSSAADGSLDVVGTVRPDELEVSYVHFPYPLELTAGEIVVDRSGRLVLNDLRTAGDASPKLAISGTVRTLGAERVFDYAIDAEDLLVDEKLREALPEESRRSVSGVGLGGRFAGRVVGRYAYDVDRPSQNRSAYRVTDLRTRDAVIDYGPRLFDIEARGGFEGRRGLAERHQISGHVQVSSARFNRLRMNDVEIDYSFGRDLPQFEDFRRGVIHHEGALQPSASLLERLRSEKISDTFQVHVRSGKLYGGTLEGFLFVDVGTRHDFGGEFVADGVQVSLSAKDVFKLSAQDVSGEAEGEVSFNGTTGDIASIKGAGKGVIQEANLGKLPLILSLASLLRLSPTLDPRVRQFSMEFAIEDEKFVCAADAISIRGDGLRLDGKGTMDFGGSLDLLMTPSFMDQRIPIFDRIFDFVKKLVLPVRIQGPLEKPAVKFSALRVPLRSSASREKSSE